MTHVGRRRLWLAGGVFAALLLALISWLALINPQLSSASSLRAQTAAAERTNLSLQSRAARLRRQNDSLGALTQQLRDVLAALPGDSGLPAFTRQVSSQASAAGVHLGGIAVGSVLPATSAAGTPPTSGTGATTPAADPAGQLFAIPITLTSTGPAARQVAFLHAVRADGPRRALVLATQVQPAAGSATASVDGSCTMTTQLRVFTAPLTADQRAQLQRLLGTS